MGFAVCLGGFVKLRGHKVGIEILIGALVMILAFQNCDAGMHGDEDEGYSSASSALAMDAVAPVDCGDYREGETWFVDIGVEDIPKACPGGSSGIIIQHVMIQDQYRCQKKKAVGTGLSRQGNILSQDSSCWSTGPGGPLPGGSGETSCGTHANGAKWWADTGQTYEVAGNCARGGTLIHVYRFEIEKVCTSGVAANTNKSRTTTWKEDKGACKGAPTPTPTPKPSGTPQWVLTTNPKASPAAVCNTVGKTAVTASSEFGLCASRENIPGSGKNYQMFGDLGYGIPVTGLPGGTTLLQRGGMYYCYRYGQKQDNDLTDRVIGYLCQ